MTRFRLRSRRLPLLLASGTNSMNLKRAGWQLVAMALTLMIGGCRPGPGSEDPGNRYVFTVNPIDLRIGSGRFCVAVDPENPRGVWWWEPGKDCWTRSTGPAVFPAEEATISRTASGALDIRFRIQLIHRSNSPRPSYADIALTLVDGQMRAPATGSSVPTAVRRDLDV